MISSVCFDVGDLWKRERAAVGFRLEGDSGGGKSNFPTERLFHIVEIPSEPGISAYKIRKSGFWYEHFVVNLDVVGEKFGKGNVRIRPVRQEKTRDIDSGKIETIEDAVIVFGRKMVVVPDLKPIAQEHIEFEMNVGPFPIDTGSCESHFCDLLPGCDLLSGGSEWGVEVSVEGKERTVPPVVVDDNVSTVVARGGICIHVDDRPGGDGADFIEGIPGRIPCYGPNIKALMQARRDDSGGSAFLIADKTVTAPAPGFAGDSFEVPVGVHVELRRIIGEDRIVREGGCCSCRGSPQGNCHLKRW